VSVISAKDAGELLRMTDDQLMMCCLAVMVRQLPDNDGMCEMAATEMQKRAVNAFNASDETHIVRIHESLKRLGRMYLSDIEDRVETLRQERQQAVNLAGDESEACVDDIDNQLAHWTVTAEMIEECLQPIGGVDGS